MPVDPTIPGPASKSLGGRYVHTAILVPSPMSEPTPVKYELLRSDRRRFPDRRSEAAGNRSITGV